MAAERQTFEPHAAPQQCKSRGGLNQTRWWAKGRCMRRQAAAAAAASSPGRRHQGTHPPRRRTSRAARPGCCGKQRAIAAAMSAAETQDQQGEAAAALLGGRRLWKQCALHSLHAGPVHPTHSQLTHLLRHGTAARRRRAQVGPAALPQSRALAAAVAAAAAAATVRQSSRMQGPPGAPHNTCGRATGKQQCLFSSGI